MNKIGNGHGLGLVHDLKGTMAETRETLPNKIGPYKIEALYRKGGMGTLYLALHPESQEPIAIKVLFSEYLTNPELVQRFLKEAEIIGLTNHPNIVQLYDQGEWEGGLYIAMEFIQGLTLKQYMLQNLISFKQALELVLEISLALCHLHGHGVIHRDLKPENILITETGGVKVIDFGIAQMQTEQQGKISEEQQKRVMGTPVYMSPEQKNNPESVSYPSDIYSLGIITYELVLGKLSHGHIHLSLMPKRLQKILAKALQPKPEDRYLDIVDFMSDISAYLHSPTLEKENQELAPLSSLSDSLRQAQQSLLPHHEPDWPQVEIGFACYKNFGVSGFYYDFLELPKGAYGIILGEPSVKGPPGIVYTSTLRGMVRCLCKLTQKPGELASVLNTLLIEDPMKQVFSFSYLILLPQENKFRFISCNCGQAWFQESGKEKPIAIESSNSPLGVNLKARFTDVSYRWEPGDSFFLFADSNKETPLPIDQLLSGIMDPPKKHVDGILRKAKISISSSTEERSLFLLHLRRTS